MNIQTRLLKLIGGLSIVGLMAVPFVSFAEEINVTAKTDASNDFCTVINSEGFKTLLKFQKDFESLNSLVDAKSAIQAAVNLNSFDLPVLMAEFRAVMNDTRPEHRAEIDIALAEAKTSIDTAITKAKADCLTGISSEKAKADFQASMKVAHEKFSAERKTIQAETKAEVSTNIDTQIKVPEIKTIDQVQQIDPVEQAQIGASFRLSIKSVWEAFKSLFNKKAQ